MRSERRRGKRTTDRDRTNYVIVGDGDGNGAANATAARSRRTATSHLRPSVLAALRRAIIHGLLSALPERLCK